MLALQCVKSVPAWLLLKAAGRRVRSLPTSRFALLRLRDVEPPRLPSPRWVRVRTRLSGICGSDLASITAEGSPFFSPITSFPFTFGHEVVGTVAETGPDVRSVQPGDRVVLEPALHCTVRGIADLCPACRAGQVGNCVNVAAGGLSPGVQTGYCKDTGGGWSREFVAHEVQLHKVPDSLSDESAVLAEPLACALHAVLRARHTAPPAHPGADRRRALILGCGSMGLLTLAALRELDCPYHVTAWARHPHQQDWCRRLGADEVIPATRASRAEVGRRAGATFHQPEIGQPTILGGYDLVFNCVGSDRAVDDALRLTAARGQTVLVGMPGIPRGVDWTTIWYKELLVLGTYTYGLEDVGGEPLTTFALALRMLARRPELAALVTHRYPLGDYRRAVQSALDTGPARAVKTVFDLTGDPT